MKYAYLRNILNARFGILGTFGTFCESEDVTAAAEAVYGYDRRDGVIRARLEHRNITGGLLKSKKDHAKIVNVGN